MSHCGTSAFCVFPLKGVLTCRALVVLWFLARLLFVNIVCFDTFKQFPRIFFFANKVLQVAIQGTITSSDLVSVTTPVVFVIEIDEDSAYTKGNDNIRELPLHGKKQSAEMNASC